jgi:hypothetical protein
VQLGVAVVVVRMSRLVISNQTSVSWRRYSASRARAAMADATLVGVSVNALRRR